MKIKKRLTAILVTLLRYVPRECDLSKCDKGSLVCEKDVFAFSGKNEMRPIIHTAVQQVNRSDGTRAQIICSLIQGSMQWGSSSRTSKDHHNVFVVGAGIILGYLAKSIVSL